MEQYPQQYSPNMPPSMSQYPPNMQPMAPIAEKAPEKKLSIGVIILIICGVIVAIVTISKLMPSGDVVSSGDIKDGAKASGSGTGSGTKSGSGSGSGTGTKSGSGSGTGSGTGTKSAPTVKHPWSSLAVGAPMRCNKNDLRGVEGSIYRYTGNDTANWYPSPAIASSWDPNWGTYDSIDCANMNLGPAMTFNMTDKTVGAPIRCTANELRGSNGSIYRYTGDNTLSWYPSPAIASSWDSNWGNYSNIDCANMKLGPNMSMR